jgi:hypothetical protein
MPLEWWKAFFEIGGVALLALTFAFGAGALIVNNRLNSLQDSQLRRFDKDLTDSKVELEKQKQLAADAAGRVAGLEHEAATAKTDMATQQARAATAERSLLELRIKVSPRRLSEEHKKELVKTLSSLPKPTSPPGVFWSSTAPDGEIYGQDFIDVFKRLGWAEGAGNWGTESLLMHVVGVHLIVHSAASRPQGAGELQQALESIGIKAPGDVDPNIPEGTFEIRIGSKE